MIYLNNSCCTMFHKRKNCLTDINDYIESELETIIENSALRAKFIELARDLFNGLDRGYIERAIESIQDIIEQYRKEEIDYAYAEAEDEDEKKLTDDGWIWGD